MSRIEGESIEELFQQFSEAGLPDRRYVSDVVVNSESVHVSTACKYIFLAFVSSINAVQSLSQK